MLDGIYQRDSLIVDNSVTIQNAEAARPIITGSDGYPPAVSLSEKSTIRGIWLGGTRETAPGRVVQVGGNTNILNCTFFGYYGVVAEGPYADNLYQFNRFVNCGGGGLYHDVYISGDTRARIFDNIFVGGEGYKVHNWHGAANSNTKRNFMAESFYEYVSNDVTQNCEDNVFWNHTPPVQSWLTVNLSKGTFIHNLFGNRTFGTGKWTNQMNGGVSDEGLTVDRLGLVGDRYLDVTSWEGFGIWVGPFNGDGAVLPAPGTNYTHYAVEDVTALLGYSEEQIDGATSALIAKFQQTTQQIHDDTTIEADFAVLSAVLAAWAAA